MRCVILFAVFFLGLFMTADPVLAQTSYNNASASNYGFAPRPNNWQPAGTPDWYRTPQVNSASQPIGSGVSTGVSYGQGGQQSVGYPQAAPNQQAAGQSFAATQYPPPNSATQGYPAAQYPSAQYPSAQYPSAQYPSAQYSPAKNHSPAQYPSAVNAPVQSSSGRLFEASTRDSTSLGGPQHQGPAAPHQNLPQHHGSSPHFGSPPHFGSSPHHAPTHGGVIQNGVTHGSPATQFWSTEAACGPNGCGPSVGPAYSTPASRWFAGVYGLLMTRDQENNVWLSYDTSDIRLRVLNSHDAKANYRGGVETRFGRFFGDGRSAFEVVYWGIVPGTEEANVVASDLVGDLDTILHFDGISYDPGGGPQLVSTAFFQAERHRLQRDYNLHNLELNLIETNFSQPCGCANLNLSWAAGIRYVKFDESFLYSTDPADVTFTGAPEELHYGIETKNDLIGFQVGGRADICFKPGFTSYIDTKLGLFANRSNQHSRIFGSNGLAEVSDVVSPYFGTPLDIRTNKTNAAFVAELRAGLDYQFTPCWSATIGYRAIGLTGVALSTNQIPVDFIGAIDSLRSVDTNGSLIAHGAFAGLEYCY